MEASTPDILTPRLELIAITLEMIHAGHAKSPDFANWSTPNCPPIGRPETGTIMPYEYVVDKMTRYPDFAWLGPLYRPEADLVTDAEP